MCLCYMWCVAELRLLLCFDPAVAAVMCVPAQKRSIAGTAAPVAALLVAPSIALAFKRRMEYIKAAEFCDSMLGHNNSTAAKWPVQCCLLLLLPQACTAALVGICPCDLAVTSRWMLLHLHESSPAVTARIAPTFCWCCCTCMNQALLSLLQTLQLTFL